MTTNVRNAAREAETMTIDAMAERASVILRTGMLADGQLLLQAADVAFLRTALTRLVQENEALRSGKP